MNKRTSIQEKPFLSIIIPAFNEQKLIGVTIENLINYLEEKFPLSEIVLVDDGSTDDTVSIVQEKYQKLKARTLIRICENGENVGKGYSVKKGMLRAHGEIRLFMDADMPFELDVLPQIIQSINQGIPIVVGARDLPGSTLVNVPFLRFIAGQVFSLLVQLFAFKGISDTQCGLKAFRAEAAQKIFSLITLNDFAFDVEALFIARKLGYEIKRVPVRMTGFRGDSRVHIIKDSLMMFVDLLRIRLNNLKGLYNQ